MTSSVQRQNRWKGLLTTIYVLQNIGLAAFFYVILIMQDLSIFHAFLQFGTHSFYLTVIFILFMQILIVEHLPEETHKVALMVVVPYLYILVSLSLNGDIMQLLLDAAFIYQATLIAAFSLVLMKAIQIAFSKNLGLSILLPVAPQLIFVIPSICASWVYLHFALGTVDSTPIYLTSIGLAIFGSIATHYKIFHAESIIA